MRNNTQFTREQKQQELEIFIMDKYGISPSEVRKMINKKSVKKGSLLTDEEKLILEMKFGFKTGKPATLREIGEVIGCSYSTVSKKMHIAFNKIYAYKF